MPAGLPAGLDRDLLAGIVNEQQIQDAGSLVWGAMLGALPLAALFGLLFFLLSLVMVGVAHRRRLYHRRHGAWNRLTKLHYPLLMLTLVILGFALGLIQSIQNSANRALDEKLQPALAEMVVPIQQKIVESLPPELAERGMTGEEIHDYYVERFARDWEPTAQEEGAGWLERMGSKFDLQVRRLLVKKIIEHAITQVGSRAGLGEDSGRLTLEAFKAIDFSRPSDEIAAKATGLVKGQFAVTAHGLRLNLGIAAAVILLLLVVDPLFYYRFWLPRSLRKAAVAADPDH